MSSSTATSAVRSPPGFDALVDPLRFAGGSGRAAVRLHLAAFQDDVADEFREAGVAVQLVEEEVEFGALCGDFGQPGLGGTRRSLDVDVLPGDESQEQGRLHLVVADDVMVEQIAERGQVAHGNARLYRHPKNRGHRSSSRRPPPARGRP